MSRAELQAHTLYNSMHLSTVDEEVKRQLIILMLSNPTAKEQGMPLYTADELLAHLDASNEAINNGDVLSMSEADKEMSEFVNAL